MSDSLGDPEAPYVRNDVSGTVNGPIVQAQHIHGGISYNVHFHSSSDRETKPDQLPSMTVRFINRSADLAVFDGWFADASTDRAASVGMGAVYGLPGVGKTAMICRWAQRSRGLFPDGQIYVDFAALRHLAGSDVSAAAAMCLRALGAMPLTLG